MPTDNHTVKSKLRFVRYRNKHRKALNEKAKAAYYAKTKEERRAITASRAEYQKQYREANKPKLRDAARKRNAARKEAIAKQKREYYLANREQFIAKQKLRYAADPKPHLQRAAKWVKDHPERAKAFRQKTYKKLFAENPERYRKRCREYRLRNIEAQRARVKKWHAENKEKARQYYLDNIERIKQTNERWRKEHPEVSQLSQARLRAKRRGCDGSYTKNDIEHLYDTQIGRCAGCLKELNRKYEIDHVMPIHLGGSNWPDNLQLLCCTCNRRKGHSHPDEWAARIGKLFV